MSHTVDSSKPITTPQKPITTAQKPEEPKIPTPKKPRRWLWILGGTVAIASVGIGVWYGFFRPQSVNIIQFNGRIEGYETDVSTKGSDPKHQKPFNATVTAIDSKASFTPENVYFQSDRVDLEFQCVKNVM
jgi:hypothetical protein